MESGDNIFGEFSSEKDGKVLLSSIGENCSAAENLSLSILSSKHVPLLNSMLCMDANDFKLILDKCQESKNIVDKYLLLIFLTDFISCVCANDNTFPINSRKNQKTCVKMLLFQLGRVWKDFFSEVAVESMKIQERHSFISVMNRGLERNKYTICGIFLEKILKMSQKMVAVENSNGKRSRTSKNKISEITVQAAGLEYCEKKTLKLFLPKTTKTSKGKSSEDIIVNGVLDCNQKSSLNCLLHKPSAAPRHRKIDTTASECDTISSSKLLLTTGSTPTVGCDVIKKKSSPGNKCSSKNLKSNSYDITRFVLKPCENKIGTEACDQQDQNLPVKRKCETSPEILENTNEPPKKKQCVNDDFVNGKVNAFKCLMMSQKKSKENKTV